MMQNRSMPPDVLVASQDHVMVRVEDVDDHRARALAAGASVSEANDHFYGERQYSAVDPSGRLWLFSQSIADLDPSEWGAATFEKPEVEVLAEEQR